MSIVDTAKEAAQGLARGATAKLVPLAPDRWIPGGVSDPLIARKHGLIGTSVSRLDGPLKVRGAARFAAEFALDRMVHAASALTRPSSSSVVATRRCRAEKPRVTIRSTYSCVPGWPPW